LRPNSIRLIESRGIASGPDRDPLGSYDSRGKARGTSTPGLTGMSQPR